LSRNRQILGDITITEWVNAPDERKGSLKGQINAEGEYLNAMLARYFRQKIFRAPGLNAPPA
jgi:hypothetical protein